jgi:hypothetical protein
MPACMLPCALRSTLRNLELGLLLQYDTGGAKSRDAEEEEAGEEGAGAEAKAKHGGAHREVEETFFDSVKRDMTERHAATRAILDSLDPRQRAEMEGHRPGVYVRIRFSGAATFCEGCISCWCGDLHS